MVVNQVKTSVVMVLVIPPAGFMLLPLVMTASLVVEFSIFDRVVLCVYMKSELMRLIMRFLMLFVDLNLVSVFLFEGAA